MDSLETAIWTHLQKLVSCGPRPIGSAANDAAAGYIESVFAAAGLGVERQSQACPDWELSEPLLEAGGQVLTAVTNPFSPACDLPGGTPIVACATLAELQEAEIEGKIAVLHGALAHHGLTPSCAVYASGPDPIAEAIKGRRPAAVVMVHSRPVEIQPLIEDWDFPIPSVTVPCGAGLSLIRAGRARLRVTCRQRESQTANLVARKPGPRPERIVLVAHFDTKHNTCGAFDNASGTAILLALAEQYAGRAVASGLEFAAFSGEDVGAIDFKAYQECNPNLEHVLAVVNLDGLGSATGALGYTVMGGSAELSAAVDALAAGFPGAIRVDPWYESDHSMFVFRGVPGIPLTTAGSPEIIHTPSDTLDWLDSRRLGIAARFAAALVETISAMSLAACRPGPGEIK